MLKEISAAKVIDIMVEVSQNTQITRRRRGCVTRMLLVEKALMKPNVDASRAEPEIRLSYDQCRAYGRYCHPPQQYRVPGMESQR